MATSSAIGKYIGNGKIKSIYCYSDGYVEHNGKLLQEFYTIEDQLDKLLALGDISYLDESPNTPPEEHTWANPVEGYVVAYHRDRGEKLRPARITEFRNLKGMYSYIYIWVEGTWYYVKTSVGSGIYELATKKLVYQDWNELLASVESALDDGKPISEATAPIKETRKIKMVTEQIDRKKRD